MDQTCRSLPRNRGSGAGPGIGRAALLGDCALPHRLCGLYQPDGEHLRRAALQHRGRPRDRHQDRHRGHTGANRQKEQDHEHGRNVQRHLPDMHRGRVCGFLRHERLRRHHRFRQSDLPGIKRVTFSTGSPGVPAGRAAYASTEQEGSEDHWRSMCLYGDARPDGGRSCQARGTRPLRSFHGDVVPRAILHSHRRGTRHARRRGRCRAWLAARPRAKTRLGCVAPLD